MMFSAITYSLVFHAFIEYFNVLHILRYHLEV